MTDRKMWADISGQMWQVGYPFCAGCPELIISGECGWEGNGCRFPEARMKMPTSYYQAFRYSAQLVNKSLPDLAREVALLEREANKVKP